MYEKYGRHTHPLQKAMWQRVLIRRLDQGCQKLQEGSELWYKMFYEKGSARDPWAAEMVAFQVRPGGISSLISRYQLSKIHIHTYVCTYTIHIICMNGID